MAKLAFLDDIQGCYRLPPDLVERIAARDQIGKAMFDAIAGRDNLTGFPRGPGGRFQASQGFSDWARPENRHLHQEVCPCLLSNEPTLFGQVDGQTGEPLAFFETMENRAKENGDPAI